MTERLPIFPLRAVLFPGDLLPLHIFEPRYRLLLSHRANVTPCFGVVLTKSGNEVGDRPVTHAIGTSAMSVEHVLLPDGRSNLLVKGDRRFQILESDWDEEYMQATIEWLDTDGCTEEDVVLRGRVSHIRDMLDQYLAAYTQGTGQRARFRDFGDDPIAFAYAVSSTLPMPVEAKQRLLEASPPNELLAVLAETVRLETALLIKTGACASLPGHPGTRFTRN
jgi:Lon protease-like protein